MAQWLSKYAYVEPWRFVMFWSHLLNSTLISCLLPTVTNDRNPKSASHSTTECPLVYTYVLWLLSTYIL